MDKLVARLKQLSKAQIVMIAVAAVLITGIVGASTNSDKPTDTGTGNQGVSQSRPKLEVKTETATQEIPFSNVNKENSSMTKGTTQITTAGANGVKTLTYEVTYTDGKQTSKKLVKEEVTTQPVTQVTSIGTYVAPPPAPAQPSCDPNYTGGCVPVVSYDLDCPDIGFRVTVVGYDRHGFDGSDNDGLGCESY